MKHDGFHTVRGYELLNQNKKELTSAMEDYLEMIYRNIGQEGYMRINMLSELLNVKPSSATRMVQKLKELGLIYYEKYGIIFLSEDGKEYGRFLLERHNVVEKFLKSLGIKENLLTETELVEHNISKNTMERINKLNQILEAHPEIISEFESFSRKNECK
ncbi:MAG TPA: iron dependent repressor, metal binding and dimerization domain protein [Clostridia bacterium]